MKIAFDVGWGLLKVGGKGRDAESGRERRGSWRGKVKGKRNTNQRFEQPLLIQL